MHCQAVKGKIAEVVLSQPEKLAMGCGLYCNLEERSGHAWQSLYSFLFPRERPHVELPD